MCNLLLEVWEKPVHFKAQKCSNMPCILILTCIFTWFEHWCPMAYINVCIPSIIHCEPSTKKRMTKLTKSPMETPSTFSFLESSHQQNGSRLEWTKICFTPRHARTLKGFNSWNSGGGFFWVAWPWSKMWTERKSGREFPKSSHGHHCKKSKVNSVQFPMDGSFDLFWKIRAKLHPKCRMF